MAKMLVNPMQVQQSRIKLPDDINAWPAAITALVSRKLTGIGNVTGISVKFKAMDQESRTAVGAASVTLDSGVINFPLIIVGNELYPLDIFLDQAGNVYPFHPLFIRLLNTSSEAELKAASDLVEMAEKVRTDESEQRKFINKALRLPKPAGMKALLKEALDDPRINAGFLTNGTIDLVTRLLNSKEYGLIKKASKPVRVSFVPAMKLTPKEVKGPSNILTTSGVKKASVFEEVPSGRKVLITVDGYRSVDPKFVHSALKERLKFASSHPYGHGVFIFRHKRRLCTTPLFNVKGEFEGTYICEDRLGRTFYVKKGSQTSIDGNTFTLPRTAKFVKIAGTAYPVSGETRPIGFDEIKRAGLIYYFNNKEIAKGKSEAVSVLSERYKNASSIIRAVSEYGRVYVPRVNLKNEEIKISCEPLNKDAIKLASVVPNRYSAVALLNLAFPIRQSVEQMKKHFQIYRIAALALARDTLNARMLGDPNADAFAIAMNVICDAALQAARTITSLEVSQSGPSQ